jgi:ribosome-associated protein
MNRNDEIEILPGFSLPFKELSFTASRSSKPGGQHVNKVSSRITLHFDVLNSPSLTDKQRELILRKLVTRISKDGMLQVASQKERSQFANKNAAVERFISLLQMALSKEKPRKKTKTPKAEKERRLDEKKQRSSLKKSRLKIIDIDD